MSSRKRLRSSSESYNSNVSNIFAIQRPPKLIIKGSKVVTTEDEKTYLRSDPVGADKIDRPMSNWDLTSLICPKFVYNIRHYGFNFAGGHKYQPVNEVQGGRIDTQQIGVLNPDGVDTDSRRFAINDIYEEQFADTIAWTAGSQAWYETLSMPGTWDTTNWNGETKISCQPSITGLINAAWTGLNNMTDAKFQIPSSHPSTDFWVRYNGGSQKHMFANNGNCEIYYELWELAPRDINRDWIRTETDSLGNISATFGNIHTLVSYSYYNNRPILTTTGNASAVNDSGSYLDDMTSTNQQNIAGQKIINKNDPGFRINKNCIDCYSKFKISKSRRGSIKAGGVLTYEIKHGPFQIKHSDWMRTIKPYNVNNTYGQATNAQRMETAFAHLVPCGTKILCIRFWSEMGQLGNIKDVADTGHMGFNYRYVTNVPGHVLHTVQEHHEIRCVPFTKQIQVIDKDFTKILFDASLDGQNANWKVTNDEDNTQTTVDTF